MLQIATGKLFKGPVGWKNVLRGPLYTNLAIDDESYIDTAAGRLLPPSMFSSNERFLVYELTECMEGDEQKTGVLHSSGVEPYLYDFSVVASFALNCVCSPNYELVQRLVSGKRGVATGRAPSTLVRRYFDQKIACSSDDLAFFQVFVKKLIELPRKVYLSVMRALRTYINGMHRIADDLELAYTLLVASVESLAQKYDNHESNWESLDDRKRSLIDKALDGAEEETATRVRQAILKSEHVALARRFREFVITHTTSEYFRRDLEKNDQTLIGRSELPDLLKSAYKSRSKYIHELRELPDAITMGQTRGETIVSNRQFHLTFQGLAGLMRNAIVEFVMRQPSIKHEPYDYHRERVGVSLVPLAPKYWVWRADGDITRVGRDKLEGFLQQFAASLLKESSDGVTALSSVLSSSRDFIPGIKKPQRLPYLALHLLWAKCVKNAGSIDIPRPIASLIDKELSAPSSESLIVHTLTATKICWSIQEHCQAIDDYFRLRTAPSGIRFPRVFEAAIVLELAERFRSEGEREECLEAIARAVENYPGHAGLLEFERNFSPANPINWTEVMLPVEEGKES